MVRHQSILLLSGGLDSAANLAFASEWEEPLLAITFRYGQRASECEVRAAQKLCEYYRVPHRIIDLDWLGQLGGSSLTKKTVDLPHLQANQLDQPSLTKESAKSVWVPNRNGVFIHIGAAFAESMNVQRILVGFNVEEAATFPDNSVEYLDRVSAALALSTSNQVSVFSYTSHWNKRQIVAQLRQLSRPFPFEMIWSCYEGLEEPCGKCESCQRLIRALGD